MPTLQIKPIPAGGTSGQVLAKTSNNDYDVGWVDGGSGTGGHTIEDKNGTQYTNRSILKFNGGVTVEDDSVNNTTVITVNSGFIVYPEMNIDSSGHLIATGGQGIDFNINAKGHLIATPQ